MYIQRSAYWPAAGHFPREVSRAFGRLFDVADGDQSGVVAGEWTPRVDIREEATRFVIEADIPGIDPKAIEISMDKGVLSIKGERKAVGKAEDGKYTRVERVHGAFQRSFALPDGADADGIHASGKHGVLEIEIPKRPETTPRKIEIAVG